MLTRLACCKFEILNATAETQRTRRDAEAGSKFEQCLRDLCVVSVSLRSVFIFELQACDAAC